MTKHLQQAVTTALQHLGIEYTDPIVFDHPNEISHGDVSTNIAMILAKKEQKNPRDLAESIVTQLKEQGVEHVQDIQIAGPGFINFFFTQVFFTNSINEILNQKDKFGSSSVYEGKKVLVEHSSPNIFKPFHIGHLMNNTIGEAIVRLVTFAGSDTTVVSYPSDVSLGIGKAVWKFLEHGVDSLNEHDSLKDKIVFLGQCYSQGTVAYDEQPEIQSRIREITQDIYAQNDTEAYRAYCIGRDLNLDYFKVMTDRLGSHFDAYIYESEAGIIGKQLIMDHTPEIYTESDGAIIYQGEQDGLHTRVFINKEGNPTYEAKDTGLLKIKFERYTPDLSIFVTDDQQGPYFQVVGHAAGKINKKWEENTIHATHGRMQFKGQKMSSRLGNTPVVEDVLDVVNEEVQQRAKKELNDSQADIVSLAALKYTILRTQAGRSINFDPETSLSFEGDSGPYLQYTYARSRSLLRKGLALGINPTLTTPTQWETTDIERYLYRFPEVTQQAAHALHPHLVVTYITQLAQLFNSWYGSTKVIDEDREGTEYRLALVEAVSVTIKNGLWLLGIEAPEEM